jgi:Family of unknown function (DUF6502)
MGLYSQYNMSDNLKRTLHAAVLRLLRPLVRLLLHHSVPYETFADLARWVYVDVAEKEFTLAGKKQTASRISVITGLNRKEVARLQDMTVEDNTGAIESFNRAEKVVTAWLHEYPKAKSPTRAAPLPIEGEHSFASLVKRYSGDMPVRAVLDELIRVGVVRKLDTGEVELVSKGQIVADAENRQALLTLFGTDSEDFISTIAHNVMAPDERKFLQRRAWSDNLPVEQLDTLKATARLRGQAVIDDFVTQFSNVDRDITPTVQGTGRARAVFGVYYYEEISEVASEAQSNVAKARK